MATDFRFPRSNVFNFATSQQPAMIQRQMTMLAIEQQQNQQRQRLMNFGNLASKPNSNGVPSMLPVPVQDQNRCSDLFSSLLLMEAKKRAAYRSSNERPNPVPTGDIINVRKIDDPKSLQLHGNLEVFGSRNEQPLIAVEQGAYLVGQESLNESQKGEATMKQELEKESQKKEQETASTKCNLVEHPSWGSTTQLSKPIIANDSEIITIESVEACLVSPELRGHAPDYVYIAFSQMIPCTLTEEDKIGKNQSLPIGLPGLCCKHCGGSPGYGRYFPSTFNSFVNGTNPDRIVAHVGHLCTKVPEPIRNAIQAMEGNKSDGKKTPSLRYGSKRLFFSSVWEKFQSESSIAKPAIVSNSKQTPTTAANITTTSAEKSSNKRKRL